MKKMESKNMMILGGYGSGGKSCAIDAEINYIDITLDEDKQQLLQQFGERIKSPG